MTNTQKTAATEELKAAYLAASEARGQMLIAAVEGRKAGLSWTEIGNALAMSKQAAQQKYGRWAAAVTTSPTPPADIAGQTSIPIDEPAADEPDTVTRALNSLGASDVTQLFYTRADDAGLQPDVQFDAESNRLTVTVNGPAPSRGWVTLYQWPGARKGTYRHYWDYASMQSMAPKKVTRYDAMKTIQNFAPKESGK